MQLDRGHQRDSMTKWKEHIYINIDIYLLNRNVNVFVCSIIVSAKVTYHLTKNCLYLSTSSTQPVVVFRNWVCSLYIFSNNEMQSFQHYNTCIMSLCIMNSSSAPPSENWNQMKMKNKARKKQHKPEPTASLIQWTFITIWIVNNAATKPQLPYAPGWSL